MLDVRDSRELQATILALKQAQRDIRLDINKTTRNKLRPLWEGEVRSRAHGRMAQRVELPARATFTDRGVKLTAATSGRPLRGGLAPSFQWQGVEFGMSPRRRTFTQHSRRGKPYQRTAWVGRQFRSRSQFGDIAFDAASQTGHVLVAMWVHTVIDELAAIPAAEVEPI